MGDARLRWFKWHLACYVVVAVALLAVDIVIDGRPTWSLFFLVAWGAPLAIHVAHVMGLLGRSR